MVAGTRGANAVVNVAVETVQAGTVPLLIRRTATQPAIQDKRLYTGYGLRGRPLCRFSFSLSLVILWYRPITPSSLAQRQPTPAKDTTRRPVD